MRSLGLVGVASRLVFSYFIPAGGPIDGVADGRVGGATALGLVATLRSYPPLHENVTHTPCYHGGQILYIMCCRVSTKKAGARD